MKEGGFRVEEWYEVDVLLSLVRRPNLVICSTAVPSLSKALLWFNRWFLVSCFCYTILKQRYGSV